jgi:hypothetical protein
MSKQEAEYSVLCGTCAYEVYGYGKATTPVKTGPCERCGRDYDLYKMPDDAASSNDAQLAELPARARSKTGQEGTALCARLR